MHLCCINIMPRVTCVVNAYTRILIGQAVAICNLGLILTGLIIVCHFPVKCIVVVQLALTLHHFSLNNCNHTCKTNPEHTA